jgi:hypothetical protein
MLYMIALRQLDTLLQYARFCTPPRVLITHFDVYSSIFLPEISTRMTADNNSDNPLRRIVPELREIVIRPGSWRSWLGWDQLVSRLGCRRSFREKRFLSRASRRRPRYIFRHRHSREAIGPLRARHVLQRRRSALAQFFSSSWRAQTRPYRSGQSLLSDHFYQPAPSRWSINRSHP